jgi:pilus assembly protein CpaE
VSVLGSRSESRRGVLRILLIGDSEDQRAQVKAALAGLSDPPLEVVEATPQSAADTNGGPPPDVAMVVFTPGAEEASLGYLQRQAEHTPKPLLFALLQERSPTLMRRILRAGGDELLFLPLDVGDLTRALLKISETRRRAERQEGGVICSLVSLVGGVGVTSLTANLGLALRYALNKRVAVVDLDLQAGGLAVFLNLEPERNILALSESLKKLDSIQLESALCKHPSGIYLLAAPKRIEDSELVSDSAIGAVLELMRQLFDFVLVDCGSYIDENSVAAWERSEHLFYLLDQSIASARCAWRFVDLFGRLGLSGIEPSFILSRYVLHHTISEDQIANTLGRPIFARIPRDEKVLERVELRAQDLWQVAPNSTLARAVEDLARRLTAAGEAPVESQGGFVSRLLSVIGPRS